VEKETKGIAVTAVAQRATVSWLLLDKCLSDTTTGSRRQEEVISTEEARESHMGEYVKSTLGARSA